MAQNFRSNFVQNVGTTDTDILPAASVDSYDAVVGVRLVNTGGESVSATVKIVRSSTDFYIVKNVEILQGSSIELIVSGSKIVLHSGDKIVASSSLANTLDALVSYVDEISS